jgi:beta-galactosidase
MKPSTSLAIFLALFVAAPAGAQNDPAVALPPEVKAVWDLEKAYREKTTTRERICLNGLWRWQPGKDIADTVPAEQWGYFKVPAFWPGTSNYIQEDCQKLFVHPAWKNTDLRSLSAAWYQREITVPSMWTNRRIMLDVGYLNSYAVVFVDGKKAGEARFPGGEVDLTAVCRPGGKHTLSLLVVALPLKGVMLSYSDTNAAREVPGTVERRGLCGDVYLASTAPTARIREVKLDTSVRKEEVTVSAVVDGLTANTSYRLRVKIKDDQRIIREFTSQPIQIEVLTTSRINATDKWRPEKLWDIHTPENMLTADVSLEVAGGKVSDVYYPVRFGFREFWIDGKDFYLNGTRIFLSAVPIDNGQIGARTASYEGVRETLKRFKSFGINFVYTHNYGCQPGSHISFEELLRAADDEGMLVGFSQPHFGHYDWKAADADRNNGYARHAEYYVRVAQNHPAVVAYSMSHNACGHDEDMNPDFIDGIQDPRGEYSKRQAALALRAEAIVKKLDPGRIVYHHSSGNLGSMHTCNFYLNWVPIQELSDWFEHWSTKGVKPVFLVEYGVPFSWDWAMYRGWYKGERSFGSARVPWEFCLAEWNAQFLGDRAYKISEREKQNLRWEAGKFKAGVLWNRWDYPTSLGSAEFDERAEVFARYITDNWPAFRTWGLSANSPWEYHVFWKLKPGVDRTRKEFKVDWETLQKPGFNADYTQRQNWNMATDFEASDWLPTRAAEALIRNNKPLLVYIAGKKESVTSRDHNFYPGETVEKQLIVLNNSREWTSGDVEWRLNLPGAASEGMMMKLETGEQKRIPLSFSLPATLAPGRYEIRAKVLFNGEEVQTDTFPINVLQAPAGGAGGMKIALFDPRGETKKLLTDLKTPFQAVEATADLSGFDVLVIGKAALTPDGPGPDVSRVRDGLKVIVFEQSSKSLEQRFGFRVVEYGLRQVFPRVPDHPLLTGLTADHLRDWRGEATLVPPRLEYTLRPQHGPTVKWCGIDVSRVWRCGNRGNVASVLIEKPARGNFLPILDGGYGLQYSPLLEFREGKGMVLFCQADVTGRTEMDPAADMLSRNILRYAAEWKPSPKRTILYAGDKAGKTHLEAAGLTVEMYGKEKLSADRILIAGPGGGKKLAGDAAAISTWLKEGGHLLAIGLDEAEAKSFLPTQVVMKKQEHIAAYFEAPGTQSLLAGIGPADVHNRDPRPLPLVSGEAIRIGNGILAAAEKDPIVFCQLVPWQFDPNGSMNLKRTYRHASYVVSRALGNMGVSGSTPLLAHFQNPVAAGKTENRWLDSYYLDVPGEWDDPYRFFRW